MQNSILFKNHFLSQRSPGWKNKIETLTRRNPRDDQDDIVAELEIMTENLRQIELNLGI